MYYYAYRGTLYCVYVLCRVYGAFTMETILATAFGCAVNVQGGESDELTKAANMIFRSLDEGSATNVHLMIVLSSKFLHRRTMFSLYWQLIASYITEGYPVCYFLWNFHLIFPSGNFPWLFPVLRMIFAHTERIVTWNLLHEIALDLVKARRKAGNLEKVSVIIIVAGK